MDLASNFQRETLSVRFRTTSWPAKAGAKTTTSAHFSANLAIRDGWAGPCGTMWRLTHDPVRHNLHASKPFVINAESLSLKKGVPHEGPLAEEG